MLICLQTATIPRSFCELRGTAYGHGDPGGVEVSSCTHTRYRDQPPGSLLSQNVTVLLLVFCLFGCCCVLFFCFLFLFFVFFVCCFVVVFVCLFVC